MKNFNGKVLFLDRNDINTDEIIPAKYLTEITKEALKPFLLEDLKLESFDPTADVPDKQAIVTRANFGCGSSREHAPWALEVNGINVVVAENFARIFRQNMYNCGMCAIEIPASELDELFAKFSSKDTDMTLNLDKGEMVFKAEGAEKIVNFDMAPFDKKLVESGGWVSYADKEY